MKIEEPESPPWFAYDTHLYRFSLGRFRFNVDIWGKRVAIFPRLDLDWEQGMTSLWLGWLNLNIGIDYEFSPDREVSLEAEYPEV